MIYPPMEKLLENIDSKYLLVNIVSRRAREIANEAEESGEGLDKKPVSCAIQEIYEGKVIPHIRAR